LEPAGGPEGAFGIPGQEAPGWCAYALIHNLPYHCTRPATRSIACNYVGESTDTCPCNYQGPGQRWLRGSVQRLGFRISGGLHQVQGDDLSTTTEALTFSRSSVQFIATRHCKQTIEQAGTAPKRNRSNYMDRTAKARCAQDDRERHRSSRLCAFPRYPAPCSPPQHTYWLQESGARSAMSLHLPLTASPTRGSAFWHSVTQVICMATMQRGRMGWRMQCIL
jgi:hypothetical protein